MDQLIQEFKEKKVMKASELMERLNNRMQLKRMVEKGVLQFVGHKGSGLYTLPEIPHEVALFTAISKYYSEYVISHYTALIIQGLCEDFLNEVHVDHCHQKYKTSLFISHKVPKMRIIGIETIDFNGIQVRIYNKERCLHESLIIGHGPTDLFFNCLKNYERMDESQKNYTELERLDHYFSQNVMSYLHFHEFMNGPY